MCGCLGACWYLVVSRTCVKPWDAQALEDVRKMKKVQGSEINFINVQEDINLKFKEIKENLNAKLKNSKDSLKKQED